MENNLSFPTYNNAIESVVLQVKQIKAGIACKVASIHEAELKKPEMRKYLQESVEKVRELNDRQYDCFREKVELEFSHKDLMKEKEQLSSLIAG